MKQKLQPGILQLNLHYSAIYAGLMFLTATLTVFAVPLLRGRGFSNEQIGVILASKYIASILCQMVLSKLADRYSNVLTLKKIICTLNVISLLITLLFYRFHFNYVGTICMFASFGMTINTLNPFIDSISMQFFAAGKNIFYSYSRAAGSLAWGIASIILGELVTLFGLSSVLALQAATIVLLFLIVITLEKIPSRTALLEQKKPGAPDGREVHSFHDLFCTYPAYTLFLLASICIFIGNSFENNFMIDIVSRVGGGNMELGYVEFALAVFELPPAVLFILLNKRIGAEKILVLCSFFSFIKLLLTYLSSSIPMLICVESLQILGIGMYWSASLYYVCRVIPLQDRVKGQSLVSICSLGLGGVLGSILSGRIMESGGIDLLLIAAIVIMAVGCILMVCAMALNQIRGRILHA